MPDSTEQQSDTSDDENQPVGWRDVVVPTESMPGFARWMYNTSPGKMLYYFASDASRFLRVSVILVATFGLLSLIVDTWGLRNAAPSTIFSVLFLDLMMILVWTGLLYGMRVLVEVAEKHRPKD